MLSCSTLLRSTLLSSSFSSDTFYSSLFCSTQQYYATFFYPVILFCSVRFTSSSTRSVIVVCSYLWSCALFVHILLRPTTISSFRASHPTLAGKGRKHTGKKDANPRRLRGNARTEVEPRRAKRSRRYRTGKLMINTHALARRWNEVKNAVESPTGDRLTDTSDTRPREISRCKLFAFREWWHIAGFAAPIYIRLV